MEKKQPTINFVLKSAALAIVTLFFISCNSKNQANISLSLSESENEKVTIEEQRVSGGKLLSKEELSSKGQLKYKFELEQPTFYNLRFKDANTIYLILNPGDKVSITGTVEKPVIEGSPDSEKLNILYDSLYIVRARLNKLRTQYNNSDSQEEKENIAAQYRKITDAHHKFSLKYILDNLSSMVSLAAIYQEFSADEFVFGEYRDLQYFKLVNDSLSKYYPRHRHVLALRRNFKQMMDSYNLEKLVAKAGYVEEKVPEIILPSATGDSVSLSSMKSKYVLLNFWTHNMPQQEEYIPKLKGVHERFSKMGFNIYNVYVGKSLEDWKRTIKFEEINKWRNVADTSFPFSITRGKYNVNTLPANYLIDAENQEILSKDLSPEQLVRTLSIKLDK